MLWAVNFLAINQNNKLKKKGNKKTGKSNSNVNKSSSVKKSGRGK